MDAGKWQRLAVLLQRHREFLLRQLAGDCVNGSPATRCEPGTPPAPRAALRSTAADARACHALDNIDAALARLAAGSYGICTSCGREISLNRLDLVPATAYCLRCARHQPAAHAGRTRFTAALAKFYRH